jgi:hypothetical protein
MASWAKISGSNASATAAETQEFLSAGLTPVTCRSCANQVLVKKTSAIHTSVQWTTDPGRSCPEFAARIAAGELSARIDSCPKLRTSIELAVHEGLVEVPDG